MLTVLPLAPPIAASIVLASVGPWNESGGDVRFTSPSSLREVISSLVEAGEICKTPSGIETDWAVGIVSAEAHAPVMQLALSESTILRAACTAACGFVSLSSWTTFTVLSTPACWLAWLITETARSDAFWPGGPKSARSPVSGIESPIVRSIFPVPPPPPLSSPPPQAARPSTKASPAPAARNLHCLRPRINSSCPVGPPSGLLQHHELRAVFLPCFGEKRLVRRLSCAQNCHAAPTDPSLRLTAPPE